ncbi:thiamine biosynthesis protein ThiJ [Amycolatopsis sp. K13G38]|uniref:Thiamine biosynthesis protein ThiJ n=1 Tax=Amycolatopsis acididurans TaxID=2724524 RepID=A0ABX1JE17_9PSEU|nr:DJ-1/PfpI family protein [Amycolatopsis acididurans]NKQ57694.1 thiamine biosynthesis protein ThiJ [Amycolatopsis acididurans]
MPRIAFVVSSAREIDLRDSSKRPTGYWAEQALTSYELFAAAGADVVVITPDGNAPVVDPYSLEPIFHYPEEDRGYFASVYRTFRRDPEDIRITLQHLTDPELVASRRIARRLEVAGKTAAEARELVSRAAKAAWQHNRRLIEVMLAEGLDRGLAEASLRGAVEDLTTVACALSQDRKAQLEDIDGFRFPVALSELSGEQLGEFDALFAPGGYASMVDLPGNPDLARLVSILHAKGAPVSALSHGPALLLAAPERIDGQWLFEGFRVTCCTNEEEDQNAFGRLGMPWYLASALQNAGAILDDAPYPWTSHVVVDRNLITGQNLFSTAATAGAVLKALGLR